MCILYHHGLCATMLTSSMCILSRVRVRSWTKRNFIIMHTHPQIYNVIFSYGEIKKNATWMHWIMHSLYSLRERALFFFPRFLIHITFYYLFGCSFACSTSTHTQTHLLLLDGVRSFSVSHTHKLLFVARANCILSLIVWRFEFIYHFNYAARAGKCVRVCVVICHQL